MRADLGARKKTPQRKKAGIATAALLAAALVCVPLASAIAADPALLPTEFSAEVSDVPSDAAGTEGDGFDEPTLDGTGDASGAPEPEGDGSEDEALEGDEAETGAGEESGTAAEGESADDEGVAAAAEEGSEDDSQARGTAINVLYTDASGHVYNCLEATEVTADDTEWTEELTGGWYVAAGEITIPNRVDVKGDVNLILADGCTLDAAKGIGVYNDNAITIWGSIKQTGTLNATGGGSGAGIGGSSLYESKVNAGTITINGGIIYAKGGSGCAGIGGGSWSNAYGATCGNAGTIVINGGTVTAEGQTSYLRAKPAAAIGGAGDAQGGSITIAGGTVNAKGYGTAAAAIGGGSGGRVDTIFITGGYVVAQGGESASSGNRGPGIGNSVFQAALDGPAYVETNSPLGYFKSGILNQNGGITVRGDQTLPGDMSVVQLTVEEGSTLTIPSGATLTNDGFLFNYGDLVIDGSLVNNDHLANTGTISGTGSFSGNKDTQAEPATPVIESVEADSVTLAPIEKSGQGATEYACMEGSGIPGNWQASTVFTGLKDNTAYTFYARYAGDAFCEPAQSTGTTVTTKELVPGAIENVTVAADNYLGADFAMPADYFAEDVLPEAALQQNARGQDVGIWMESARVDDRYVTDLVTSRRGEFLPLAYFSLVPHYQVDGETPEAIGSKTNDDALVQVRLTLPDSAVNTDSTVTREYKVICVYENTNPELPCSFDPDTNELTFRTNRFTNPDLASKLTANFGLVYKDTRDGKQVFPVMVRDSYAGTSGQGQYAEGDKVTVYAGEREGYVVEFWSAATAQGSVSFTDQGADRAEFTMPAKPVVVSITWKRIGDIRDVTDVAGNALQAQLVDAGRSLADKVLPEDAMNLVLGGMNVDIWLDSADGMSGSDAAAVSNALDGWTLAEEVGLTLFYGLNGSTEQVHEAQAPLTVRLTLPDSAINADDSKERSYEVIRVHDGEAEVLPAAFDAQAKALMFETDRFSAYAVAYKDVASGSVSGGGGDSRTSGLAATGDALVPMVVLLGLVAVLTAVTGAFSCRKVSVAQRGKHAR